MRDTAAPAALAPTLVEIEAFLAAPPARECERLFLAGDLPAAYAAADALRAEVRQRGWWCPPLPRELGGMGLDLPSFARVSRLLGRHVAGHLLFHCQAPDIGNMELLREHGDDEQRRRFLAPLAAGEVRSCFAMTEPDRPGSNPTWMETRAERDGGDYVITGRKWFASSADGAAFAVVMAVTDPAAARHRRASMFVVPADTPGFRLVENLPVMGHRGEGWASHAEVAFERCRVPAALRLGPEGDGFALAQARLGPGRIHHAMRWIGIADRSLELLCRHALARPVAPGRALAEEPVLQADIATIAVGIRTAALLAVATAERIEREGSQAAREEISALKLHACDVMLHAVDRALQAHGALGMTDRTPLAFWWRHERAARIYDGPDEVHRRLVAREVLARFSDGGDVPADAGG